MCFDIKGIAMSGTVEITAATRRGSGWRVKRGRETDRQTDGQTETEREKESENWNSKTLFYKDCSLGSVKNLTTSPC